MFELICLFSATAGVSLTVFIFINFLSYSLFYFGVNSFCMFRTVVIRLLLLTTKTVALCFDKIRLKLTNRVQVRNKVILRIQCQISQLDNYKLLIECM